jgi:hypothetical protein
MRVRVLVLVAGIMLALVIVSGTGASAGGQRQSSRPAPPAPVARGHGPLLNLLPQLELIHEPDATARLLELLQSVHTHADSKPACRGFVPGTERLIPIPTHYRDDQLLLGSPTGRSTAGTDQKSEAKSPRLECVGEAGR